MNVIHGWWEIRENGIKRTVFLLFLGQVISFVMSLMSFSSSLLATLGVDTPLTLSFFAYLALSIVYGSIFIYRRQKLQVSWYWYLLIGFADVQGNFLVNKAFQYSSITSVTMLDCFTIAWVILLTWFFLGKKYSLWQFLGAAVCVTGLGLVLLSDAGVGGGGGSRPVLGDTFVIMGTLFFAFSNVGEEVCVKKKDRVEVITMIAVSGLLVSICEIALLERKSVASVKLSTEIILAFVGFAFAAFLFYSLVPYLLKMSGATLFNLSLLTSDMWAVIIRIFFYKQKVDWLYYLAFGLVGIGLIVYSKTDKASDSALEIEDGLQYQILDEECTDARNITIELINQILLFFYFPFTLIM